MTQEMQKSDEIIFSSTAVANNAVVFEMKVKNEIKLIEHASGSLHNQLGVE